MVSKSYSYIQIFLFLVCLLGFNLSPFQGVSQGDSINIVNGSFEGPPMAGSRSYPGISARGWDDCGRVWFPGETPPDIHPTGAFGVYKKAQSGRTYLGLVVRDNETWEGVTQRLTKPLEAGACYSFSIQLCRSDQYYSPMNQNKITDDTKSYTRGAVLRIYGGNSSCDKREILGESELVHNTDWEAYDFNFEPNRSYNYITLEAFYKTPVLIPYNGNLLLDNASKIARINCPGEELAVNEESEEITEPVKEKPVEVADVTPVVAEKPVTQKPNPKPKAKFEPKILSDLNRKTLKKGQVFKIKKLYFAGDSTRIEQESYPVLDELKSFLVINPDVRVEIGGHTNNTPEDDYCDKLSLNRAKEVAYYLIRGGVSQSQLEFKGYGKRKPIASNKTKEGRKRNQRVEITILSLDG